MLAQYYGDRALAGLRAAGDVTLNATGHVLTTAELIDGARGCDIIVADRQTPGEAAVFQALPDLIAFSRVAIDIRNIDVTAASAQGVLVTQASAGFIPAVAEWIVGAMIDAGRHTTDYTGAYRRGETLAPHMGYQLNGATIGIIGYGAIGVYLSRLAAALGMHVLVYDPYKKVEPPAMAVEMPQLLAQADYVVPLAVATPETENLINEAVLLQMKRSAWLINASRGNLVDEAALQRALDTRRIAGAAMDVGRAPDQQPSPSLARRPDVIASPHVAGLTPQAIEHQALDTVRQAGQIVRGEIPEGAVNAAQATRIQRLKAL
jgi:D-3-phosphoglycerate dehydrogenase